MIAFQSSHDSNYGGYHSIHQGLYENVIRHLGSNHTSISDEDIFAHCENILKIIQQHPQRIERIGEASVALLPEDEANLELVYRKRTWTSFAELRKTSDCIDIYLPSAALDEVVQNWASSVIEEAF